jgi:predicted transcriptional regulator
MANSNDGQELLSLTTEIVAFFVGNNTVAIGHLLAVIASVFRALRTVEQDETEEPAEALEPAVPIRKSIGRDFLVCLEDGKKVKTLKRHLADRYNLTPGAYRQRWGLAKNYPMVAPAYAARRWETAKRLGLGRKPAAAAPARGPSGPEGGRLSGRGRTGVGRPPPPSLPSR